MDETTFRAAAVTCRVENLTFTREVSEQGKGRDSSSPARKFGQWWIEKREREKGVRRAYLVNVSAICGGIGPYGGDHTVEDMGQRQAYNRKFECLSAAVSRVEIDVKPTCTVHVD
jgi:hypothetical protein